MLAIEVILIMIFLVILSNIINKWIPKISIPIIQILIGALMGMINFGFNIDIDPHMFMLIFIAPILFMDGKKFSSRKLWYFKKPILYMSLGLVFLTVLICGYIIYLLVPELPLAVAFGLAAVLSPTDAVAVKAISSRINLPNNVTTIVEGESLINDASGLVAFNFAIAAHLTGVFSVREVTIGFIYIAFGGAILGAIGGYVVNIIIIKLKSLKVEDPAVYTIIQIITPFAIFLVAEELGFSGILAVVACGVTTSLSKPEIMTTQEASIRFVSDGAWSTFLFALNGLIFLLLGMQLPTIFMQASTGRTIDTVINISYILTISILLITIRYIWVYLFIGKEQNNRAKNAVLISLSGVRGALTLAACLSIPLVMDDGIAFPQRDLILFISSGVIIFTLVIANVLLPLMSPTNSNNSSTEIEAYRKVIKSSLKAIRKQANNKNKETANLLIEYYKYLLVETLGEKETIEGFKFKKGNIKKSDKIFGIGLNSERVEVKKLLYTKILEKEELEFRAIQIQKIEIQKLLEKGEITYGDAYKLRRNISLEEAALFEGDLEK